MSARKPDGQDQAAGAIPASMLILLCAEPQPPQPIEILKRLEAGYTIETVDEDGPPDAVWSRLVRVEGLPAPVFISCRARADSYQPWETRRARWRDEAEFQAARESRWMLIVETTYAGATPPNQQYHAHLRLADVIADGLAAACVDAQCGILRSHTTLHELAHCEIEPAPDEMYTIDAVSKGRHVWLHTHGLERFATPDLELLHVPSARWRDAYTALQWLVAFLLPVDVPEDGLDVEFGAGLHARLMPAEPLVAGLASDALGGAEDRADSHDGWRMLVSDRKRDGSYSITRLLRAVRGDPVFWLSDEESARRANLARVRFGLAAAAWFSTQWRTRRMGVKVGVPFNNARDDLTTALVDARLPRGGSREHMWFELQAIEGQVLVAKLENEPVYATYLKRGESYRLPVAQISEFHLTLDEQHFDPATISELDIVTLHTGK